MPVYTKPSLGNMINRTGIESRLLQHWYGEHQPPWYLRMLVPIYRAGYQRAQNRQGSETNKYRSALPLIIVGNITAGGSGKTPLVIRLCQLAVDLDLKPGIASTGYGRQGMDTVVVQAKSDTNTCGDEPVLLAKRTGVPVVVATNRLDAVKKLNEMDLDLIFSDDGLQTATLDRDIEICVIDGERGLGNGYLIPAGPLREAAGRLRKVDHVISNGMWPDKPAGLDVNIMQLRPNVVCSLDETQQFSVEEFRQKYAGISIHAVAGIGNPQRFFEMLDKQGIKTDSQAYSDHHSYIREDFDSIKAGSAIIMTEKDAVKCRSLGLENAWYVPVDTCLPEEFECAFADQLVKLTRHSQ